MPKPRAIRFITVAAQKTKYCCFCGTVDPRMPGRISNRTKQLFCVDHTHHAYADAYHFFCSGGAHQRISTHTLTHITFLFICRRIPGRISTHIIFLTFCRNNVGLIVDARWIVFACSIESHSSAYLGLYLPTRTCCGIIRFSYTH